MSCAHSFQWNLVPTRLLGVLLVVCCCFHESSAATGNSLVAHYALNDRAGTTAIDASGGNHHGTLMGYDLEQDGWTDGQLEGALGFDGNNDYVTIPHHNDFNLTTYTLSAWVKVSSGSKVRTIIVKGKFDDGINSTDVPFAMYLDSNHKLTLGYEKASSSQKLAENMSYTATGPGLTPGQTHHVAITRLQSTKVVVFYIDGQNRGTFENTPKPGDNKKELYLGADPVSGNLFKGGLDDIRIYSQALEPSGIQALFQLGSLNEQETSEQETSRGDETSTGGVELGSAEEEKEDSPKGDSDPTTTGEPDEQIPNEAPRKITLSKKSIHEGRAIGTSIGRFTVTDPNDPEGKGNYDLMLLLSSGDNKRRAATNRSKDERESGPFYIGSNGVLRTGEILDYETRNSYAIRVKATDEGGLSVEKDFVIQVENAFIPIVKTIGVSRKKSRLADVEGKIVSEGQSSVTEVGLVVSTQPQFDLEEKNAKIVSTDKFSQKFELSVKNLEPETTYYCRVYAKNSEGIAYGAQERFTTLKSNNGPWSKTTAVGNGWLRSNWLGYLYPTQSGWVYHKDLGWLYAQEGEGGGVWLYSKDFLGWFWTGQDIYPFVFTDKSRAWAYFQGNLSDHRVFYHFGQKSWLTIPRADMTKNKKGGASGGTASKKR